MAYLAQACGQSGCVNGCINKTQHINRDKDFDFDKKKNCQFPRISTEIQTNITHCLQDYLFNCDHFLSNLMEMHGDPESLQFLKV